MIGVYIFILVSYSIINNAEAQAYTTKYDNINIDEIITNERVLNSYTKCLLDQGKCTQGGDELKKVLPDALVTNCMSCSAKQRTAAMRIIAYLTANKPGIWKSLSAKYDPQGVYRKRYRNL